MQEKINCELWNEKNTPIAFVEMGNEFYIRKVANEIGGPSGYYTHSKKALAALRKGGYQGPVGISIAPEWVPPRGGRK